MQIDDAFLLRLLLGLQAAERVWHDIGILDDDLLLDEQKLLFHLEQLLDGGYIAHRPAASAVGGSARDRQAEAEMPADPWIFSLRDSALRLTAQGHQFADSLLAQAKQQAARKAVMRQRMKSPPREDDAAEVRLQGIEEIRTIFKIG